MKVVKDENGKLTTTEYDVFGRPVKVQTADGNASTIAYGDLNRKATTTNSNDKTTVTFTDHKGQKILDEVQNGTNTLVYLYNNLNKATDA